MRAFTLIELIFVIILIGILSVVSIAHMPDNTLPMDRDTLKFLILQKKSNALNFKANMNDEDENKTVCITLTKDSLNEEENSSKVRYYFKSEIDVSGISGDTVCFDQYGRPFDGAVKEDLSNICQEDVIITLNYRNKQKQITIYKMSGAVE